MVTPLWLLGLLGLPLIRWLHRGGRHRRVLPVAFLALWQGSAAAPPAAGQRQPPDPAWRRRALLAAMLLVALAGPQWPQQHTPVTLWVDDSISMLTHEAQGTRLSLGLAQARALLAGVDHAEVEVRTLGDPWHRLGGPGADSLDDTTRNTLLASAGRREPAAPPAALLRDDRAHWLLTDGADAGVFDWPGQRTPDRLIQVGSEHRNVGLQRLSVRRHPDDRDRFELQLRLNNGGDSTETRTVLVVGDTGELTRSRQTLAAGSAAEVLLPIPAVARVHARLLPGDALAEDDEIVLDLAPLRQRRVAIDARCAAALQAAVATHPALRAVPAGSGDLDLRLDCGSGAAAPAPATLHVLADRLPARPAGPLRWSSAVAEADRLRLDADTVRFSARLQAAATDQVLLAAGDLPLIVGRGSPSGPTRLIETSLDFGAMAGAGGPAVPLLLNTLVERLLGAPLLDPVVVTDRGPNAARVRPLPPPPAAAPAAPVARARRQYDATNLLLLAAAVVLLWEIAALARQWRRLAV